MVVFQSNSVSQRFAMRIIFCATALLTLVPVALIVADDQSPSKFEVAKTTYTEEVSKVDNAISEAIENRLALAHKSGNIRAVDACLAEKKAFLEYGDLPLQTPIAQQRKLIELAKTMDKAYSDELKVLTREMKIPLAKALIKEQQSFHQRIAIRTTRITLMGDWKLQMGGYSSIFTFYPDGTMFHSTENFYGTWRVDLETQQIVVSPPGSTGGDRINLPLNPKGTNGLSTSGGVFKLTKK
jgi:hypothetical protein